MNEDHEFSLEDRQLCSDGACIGTIGDNGLCKVCGKTGDGENAENTAPAETTSVFDESPDEEHASSLDDRIPCPDGTCIGIIGPDGKCGTCGQTNS